MSQAYTNRPLSSSTPSNTIDTLVIGSGMAGLTAACLLTHYGQRVHVLEQNWLPGGCSSSYPRKNYIFESGATTLVGLDEYMPVKHLLDVTGVEIKPWVLPVPMKVYLKDGTVITRHHDLEAWIEEAERVFGPKGQRPFWEYCFKIAQFVWEVSLKQRAFPPSNISDLFYAARHFRPKQLGFATLAFKSMKSLLDDHGLLENKRFVAFVDEQLLITAQNHHPEVNVPFGATALCYTNFTNYYMPGGLLKMVEPMVEYLKTKGSNVTLQAPVKAITPVNGHYEVQTKFRKQVNTYKAQQVVSAIPINNTLDLYQGQKGKRKAQRNLMQSEQLNSAFQMGIVAKRRIKHECLHHQIHLEAPLPYAGSHSIFLSLSHPDDTERCGPDEVVASISTHVPDPQHRLIDHKEEIEQVVFETLEKRGLIAREDVIFHHSSTPGAWEKWTGRAWGFVGGYPQYMSIKPWQMLDARFDHEGMYICGDSTYPGQGIPGACLSGIVAVEKMRVDGKLG